MSIVIAIIIFSLIITIHEFGHFIAAKSNGVRVNEFAIGMGPAIFKKKKGETLYALRVFPIGGYCAIIRNTLLYHDPDLSRSGHFHLAPPASYPAAGVPDAEGQSARKAQALQSGRCAWQTRRPW